MSELRQRQYAGAAAGAEDAATAAAVVAAPDHRERLAALHTLGRRLIGDPVGRRLTRGDFWWWRGQRRRRTGFERFSQSSRHGDGGRRGRRRRRPGGTTLCQHLLHQAGLATDTDTAVDQHLCLHVVAHDAHVAGQVGLLGELGEQRGWWRGRTTHVYHIDDGRSGAQSLLCRVDRAARRTQLCRQGEAGHRSYGTAQHRGTDGGREKTSQTGTSQRRQTLRC